MRTSRFIVGVVAALVLAVCARAQVMPLVPDPITTPELMKYADLIGLSDQQRIGMLTAHDAYKERYKQFQDRDVKKLRDAVVDIALRFRPGRFSIPPRKELEEIVEQYKRVLNATHAVDRTFFDEVSASLTEEQTLKLQRARTARELAAYHDLIREFAGNFNRGAGADLTELVRELKLPPEELEKAEPILVEYESTTLSKAREIYATMTKAVSVVLDVIDQLGLRDMTPDKMMALMQDQNTIVSLQNTFDEASKPFQAATFDLSQLNLRTYKRLAAVLSAEKTAALRAAYYERAYSEAYRGLGRWQQRYRDALDLKELTDEQKQNIQAQRDSYVHQEDSLVDNVVPALEASREYRTFDQLRNEEQAPIYQKLEDLGKRLTSLDENATAALYGVIGPELTARLDEKNPKDIQAASHGAHIVAVDGDGSAQVIAAPEPAAIEEHEDPLLAQPMSAADLKQINAAVEFSQDNQTVLSTLYDEYRGEYDALRKSPLEFEHPDTKPTAGDEAKARRSRAEALAAIDAKFFDNADVIADTPRQHLVLRWNRDARQREAVNKSAQAFGGGWYGFQDAYADPILFLARTPLDDATSQAVQAIVDDYSGRIAPMVMARLDTARELQRRMNAQQRAGRVEGGEQAAQMAREKWMQSMRDLRKLNKDIRAVNRQALADLSDHLPSSIAWTLKTGYNRDAFPEIYQDPESADKVIDECMSIGELGASEREAVMQINDSYRTEYTAICDRMIDLRQQRRDFDFTRDEMFKRDDVDREVELERLRFERKEISARAKLRIKLALPADIAQRLSGLNLGDS